MLINLFVVPIAMAGMLTFTGGQFDSDMFVLALPLSAGSDLFTIVAFVGGLSAATAMVIVESVALAIMVSNDIVMPLVLQRREGLISGRDDVGRFLLTVRRMAIFVILFLAYLYYRLAGDAQLASIGLLSFAAIAQLAPAFFGGLIWRRATARGAMAGMTTGILVWAYTLLLPSFADAGIVEQGMLSHGPWSLGLLRPQGLFGLDLPPLVHGVVWSLSLNVLAYVVFSFGRAPASIERLQSDLFAPSDLAPMAPSFRLWRSSVTIEELTTTIARYLGEERTRTSFDSYATDPRRRARSQGRRRLSVAALRRTPARIGDRRGLVAARFVAAAAQAHRVHQGRAAAARRCQRSDPLQPRDLANRARSCAAGHRGVRQGPPPRLLEPAVRGDSGVAAATHPRRHRPARDLAAERRAHRCERAGGRGAHAGRGWHATRRAANRFSNASRSAIW